MSSRLPQRRTSELRKGRVSVSGATYFITICTADRLEALSTPSVAAQVVSVFNVMQDDRSWNILIATVMPDHVHVLFELGSRLPLFRSVAKFKSLIRNKAGVGWHWQDNVFEHRLRPNERASSYAMYVFLNPYRAGLVSTTTCWSWWVCPAPHRFTFLSEHGVSTTPRLEWLRDIEEIENDLNIGE